MVERKPNKKPKKNTQLKARWDRHQTSQEGLWSTEGKLSDIFTSPEGGGWEQSKHTMTNYPKAHNNFQNRKKNNVFMEK